ncbi:MAG: TetR/AcrR family transcriptional regulator [Acidobacteria bacterium]|nr:TetR/AcrR family transcriptional regulator [Acidobacteriota bacterium]
MAARRLSAEARRAQLLSVARDVFAADGYHGAAMEQIAGRAGVTKPVLYQHFAGKKELYLALLQEEMGRLHAHVSAAIENASGNRARIQGGVAAYFRFIEANEGSFHLLFRETMGADPDFRAMVERFRDAVCLEIAAIIGAETGLRGEEAELLARGAMGMAESAAQWWLERREGIVLDEVVRDLSELAWRGLAGLPRAGGET